ncbi:morphogenic membrane protein MmpA [Streptomyces sp. NPDC057682]
MNAHRTSGRTVPSPPAPRRVALGVLLGGAVGLVWAGAMLYTLASWIL